MSLLLSAFGITGIYVSGASAGHHGFIEGGSLMTPSSLPGTGAEISFPLSSCLAKTWDTRRSHSIPKWAKRCDASYAAEKLVLTMKIKRSDGRWTHTDASA